jgi:RNA polymerase sigma-70 factor (ECF subfamily)
MSPEPAASESGDDSDQTKSSDVAHEPRLSEIHTRRIEELFRDEYARLVHYMVAKTHSWPEARDIAAQAFAQVLEMRDPETVSFLKAYVYRAARNLATDRARIAAIRSRIGKIVLHEFTGTSPSPEPLLMQRQRLQILEHAMKALRPTRRMVLRWRVWEELPYAQIEARFAAQGLLVNERTLHRWYADALEELRQAIRGEEELKEVRAWARKGG